MALQLLNATTVLLPCSYDKKLQQNAIASCSSANPYFISRHYCTLVTPRRTDNTAAAHDDLNTVEKRITKQKIKSLYRGTYTTDFLSSLMVLSASVMATISFFITPSPAAAADPIQTYNCIANGCRTELKRCITNPSCAANLTCLETCNNRPDEEECLMRCGDLFENPTVDQFNTCVISTRKCVPRQPDDGSYPVPPSNSTVQDFDTLEFKGKWYISSGLNPMFDIYDCQTQEFSSPSPHRITAKLSWRIKTPDGGFLTRSTLQNLVQDATHPGILYNHDNELLNYEDEWYILSAQIENKADDYVFVYYRGRNDAWDGFGGAVVYTRNQTLPLSIVPKVTDAAKKVGLDFIKFQNTDNSCPPQLPLLERLEKNALGLLRTLMENARD